MIWNDLAADYDAAHPPVDTGGMSAYDAQREAAEQIAQALEAYLVYYSTDFFPEDGVSDGRVAATTEEVALMERDWLTENDIRIAADGTHWIWVPETSEWTGWMPGEDGVWVRTPAEMSEEYPELAF
jgi:hypothetical protein